MAYDLTRPEQGSANLHRPDFGNLRLSVGLEASRPTYWGVWGAEPPRKKGSYVLHVRVGSIFSKDFLEYSTFTPEMKPMSNIVY